MADLRDFLQSMSNSAASNVSAPVDGINWLLGKAGLPVSSAPFMGSDWMAQKGLTRPVEQGTASILGETAGMVAPMVIAAKAPQIARGLLQAGENAMAPRTLNPQTGAIVWHGSPHKFDKFDSSKIGTGEGAQAYGHGLYLAENPKVATEYSKMQGGAGGAIPSPLRYVNGQEVQPGTGAYKAASLLDNMSVAQAKKTVSGWMQGARPEEQAYFKEVYDTLGGISAKSAVKQKAPGGSLYKVDLPDEHIAKMLDWDKPLSQQHPDVQAALKSNPELLQAMNKDMETMNYMRKLTGLPPNRGASDMPMQSMIKQLGDSMGGQAQASDYLRQAGIPGIRYLDGGSRGAGQGSSNFVVFPGNEDILKIMERNGKGLLGN